MEADSVVLDRFKPRGATRMWRALGASMRGLRGAFREEAAFRQEVREFERPPAGGSRGAGSQSAHL